MDPRVGPEGAPDAAIPTTRATLRIVTTFIAYLCIIIRRKMTTFGVPGMPGTPDSSNEMGDGLYVTMRDSFNDL